MRRPRAAVLPSGTPANSEGGVRKGRRINGRRERGAGETYIPNASRAGAEGNDKDKGDPKEHEIGEWMR